MDSVSKFWSMDSLPPEVLMEIFRQLNLTDVQSARQVCKKWKTWIDLDLPLNVIVDDTKKGNCPFVKRVLKEEVSVLSLRTGGIKSALINTRRANSVRKMNVRGLVGRNYFNKVVPQFQWLVELKIGGEVLTLPLNLRQQFTLISLKTLELYSAFKTEASAKELRKSVIPVAKNTTAFLRNIRCPQIRSVMIDGDVDQIHIPWKYEWKEETLMTFLERYSGSLKKVLIGESCILKGNPRPIRHDRNYSTALRSLHFSFYGNQDRPLEKNILWYNLLAAQRQLELLNVGALWYSHIPELLRKLPVTMRHLSIFWNWDFNPTFNCEVFMRLVNLERLELTFDGNFRQIFVNMLSLRKCKKLKVIVSEQGGIPADDLEQFSENFPNLRVLYLYRCGSQAMVPDGPECGITLLALQNILSMRKLDYFFCTEEDFLGDQETVDTMIGMLTPIQQMVTGRDDHEYESFHIGEEPKPDLLYDDISFD